jgi:hypothetical protein
MTPRETRAWLAKYVLGKGDLTRLAEHLCVAATPAAVVAALLSVSCYHRGSSWSPERDARLRGLRGSGASRREIQTEIQRIPGPPVSLKAIEKRTEMIGAIRPPGVAQAQRPPEPAVTAKREEAIRIWNEGALTAPQIATQVGRNTSWVHDALRVGRQRGMEVRDGR